MWNANVPFSPNVPLRARLRYKLADLDMNHCAAGRAAVRL
jgi:hypothetical protein